MGAVLGGGAAEAAFGADTANVLTKATKYSAILFFVLAFALYLGRIYERKLAGAAAGNALPTISAPAAPATPAPATGAAATTPPAAGTTATPSVSVPATPAPTETPATTTPAPAPEQAKK
jgi:preprotein translocase subunit SecG